MITKITTPIIGDIDGEKAVIGLKIKYRFFKILFYKKISYSPIRYGVKEYDFINP